MGRYLELEDMPLCRACGCAPVIKGNRTLNGCGNTRLQCPECGIRTGQSTDGQAKFRVWLAVMADRDDRPVYCPLEHAWIDGCPDECDMCPGTGA